LAAIDGLDANKRCVGGQRESTPQSGVGDREDAGRGAYAAGEKGDVN
jgi:hypothetical protein